MTQIAEYKRSFEDELDWNLLQQFHNVVLQIGTFCFRTKQICLTVELGVIALLIKFTGNKLDSSVFVGGLAIPLCFWFLDSVGYFYQLKLRGIMENIRERLLQRNSEQIITVALQPIIEKYRVERPRPFILLNAFFNASMLMYFILVLSNLILWYLFAKDFIG